ncbi:MAG: hypothetical protein SGI83_02340 [Bacteroidota bacterium]|nr:hypothetical protein [Bacteroidota bacterium]
MKYSYPDSLITLVAAFVDTHKRSVKEYTSTVAGKNTKNPTGRELNSTIHNETANVGIKFDNISARKYFALIHYSRQPPVMNKATEKEDVPIRTESHVTPEK